MNTAESIKAINSDADRAKYAFELGEAFTKAKSGQYENISTESREAVCDVFLDEEEMRKPSVHLKVIAALLDRVKQLKEEVRYHDPHFETGE